MWQKYHVNVWSRLSDGNQRMISVSFLPLTSLLPSPHHFSPPSPPILLPYSHLLPLPSSSAPYLLFFLPHLPLPPFIPSLPSTLPLLFFLLLSLLSLYLHSDPVFEPRPSLQAVADFVVKDTIRKYPVEACPYCGETALPADPKVH